MLPAHEEILSIQLVTNNKYARQVRSCAAGLDTAFISGQKTHFKAQKLKYNNKTFKWRKKYRNIG
jgi:hypothetical protein